MFHYGRDRTEGVGSEEDEVRTVVVNALDGKEAECEGDIVGNWRTLSSRKYTCTELWSESGYMDFVVPISKSLYPL